MRCRARRCLAVILMFALGATLSGSASNHPPVRALGNGLFEIGQVTINKNERWVAFRAAVNLRDQTVEYAVVHQSGKTHESIFSTSARPLDIHLAMLLLGAKPVMTNSFGNDGKAPPRGERVAIEVNWTNAGMVVRCAMEDLVLNRDTKQAMPRGEWIYNGSNFSEGAFTAQRDGSIISIHIDPDALMNNPRPGRENDDLHTPHTAKLPSLGTAAEIKFRLVSIVTNTPARR